MVTATFHCRLADESPADAVPVTLNNADWWPVFHWPALAAERFAASYDRQAVEWPPCREVVVRHPDGREETFDVECVSCPEYHARPKRG